jgi:hypothetical protein
VPQGSLQARASLPSCTGRDEAAPTADRSERAVKALAKENAEGQDALGGVLALIQQLHSSVQIVDSALKSKQQDVQRVEEELRFVKEQVLQHLQPIATEARSAGAGCARPCAQNPTIILSGRGASYAAVATACSAGDYSP